MQNTHDIVVAKGDGIGPEIMDATLQILESSGFKFNSHEVLLGEKAYLNNFLNGIEDSALDKIINYKNLLKAPLFTPQGKGYKSANVTLRKILGMYANVRPNTTYEPILKSSSKLNVVIIRENEEDTYAGIEHRQTNDVIQCIKLITRPGCERIIHYAFEYARINKRKKVTCLTKDNIMKMSDGLFHTVFDEVAKQYPDIINEHLIVDIGTAKLASSPENFDVVVTLNLYGDIISDVVAEIAGSIGLAPSANIGQNCSMFEAVHGSAPDIANKDIANPSALLLSAVMMLVHLKESDIASLIHNAWLKTLEDGIHTGDMKLNNPTKMVGTKDFTQEIINRLGEKPQILTPKYYVNVDHEIKTWNSTQSSADKKLVGVDIFIDNQTQSASEIANLFENQNLNKLNLHVITNRGVKMWPHGLSETFCTDHWRLRFSANSELCYSDVIDILTDINLNLGLDIIKTENLYTFDGVKGFSEVQGS